MATLKNTTINDTGFLSLPVGNISQRPGSPATGMVRWNTTTAAAEMYNGASWVIISPSIVTTNLVLYLDAANPNSYPGTGTTWTDLSGAGNNGTLVNGVSYDTTNGGRMIFDGTNDYVEIPSSTSLNFGTGEFTVLCWVSGITSYPGSAKSIIWKGGRFDGNSPGWSMTWAGSPQDLYFLIGSSSDRLEARTQPNFGLNGWSGYKMIGMQRSGTNWNQINNTQITTLGSYSGNVDSNSPITIALNGFYSVYLSQIVSAVQIYNRALTAQEISQNFNALRGRYGL